MLRSPQRCPVHCVRAVNESRWGGQDHHCRIERDVRGRHCSSEEAEEAMKSRTANLIGYIQEGNCKSATSCLSLEYGIILLVNLPEVRIIVLLTVSTSAMLSDGPDNLLGAIGSSTGSDCSFLVHGLRFQFFLLTAGARGQLLSISDIALSCGPSSCQCDEESSCFLLSYLCASRECRLSEPN